MVFHLLINIGIRQLGLVQQLMIPRSTFARLVNEPLDAEVIRQKQLVRAHQILEDMPILPGVLDFIQKATKLGIRNGDCFQFSPNLGAGAP